MRSMRNCHQVIYLFVYFYINFVLNPRFTLYFTLVVYLQFCIRLFYITFLVYPLFCIQIAAFCITTCCFQSSLSPLRYLYFILLLLRIMQIYDKDYISGLPKTPTGTHVRQNGNDTSYYSFHTKPMTWYEAMASCRQEGSKSSLVSINSKEEQDYLVRAIKNNESMSALIILRCLTSFHYVLSI